MRNDIFDAKNFFVSPTASKPPFKQNQFGASLGGPIQKNKTFFFADYEGERIRQSQTQLFTVPTAFGTPGNFTGSGITVNMPGTTTLSRTIRSPLIDPVAAAMLAKIPHADPGLTASNNLNDTALSTMDVNQYNARIDHTFSASDNVFVRVSIFDANQFLPFGSAALNEALFPAFGYNCEPIPTTSPRPGTMSFNTSWLNELRFGWMWVGGGEISPNAGINFAGQTGCKG